ncbi:MAG: hypothetical protein SGI72_07965 [Planctomycetota bacterium]|nr:hypothetical protein [Planctomycetota bacterium]
MKTFMALMLLVLVLGCSADVREPASRSFVTRMVIDDGKESSLECDTGRWRGKITIAPDVKVGYRNVTTTGVQSTESKTTLTLNEVLMTVEPNGLLFGTDTRVNLSGDVAVDVRTDGIYVKGAKVASLPSK